MKRMVTLELLGHCKVPALRPHLWSMVTKTRLGGWTANTMRGVQLFLEGDDREITLFLHQLPDRLTRWFDIEKLILLKDERIPDSTPPKPFRLVGPVFYESVIGADRAPCPECKKKMLDPESRFYRYPFLSCPECGPRYSAILQAGGERDNTVFRAFPKCKKCKEDPGTHAILCCPDCGPSAFLIRGNGEPVPADDPVAFAGEALAEGKIVAVKNYDGFVILSDPSHPETVRTIRERKRQLEKPVSWYVNSMETVRKYCQCSQEAEELLTSPAAPMVLLHLNGKQEFDPSLFCPDHPGTIGIQFPQNGLLYLLLESCPDGKGGFRSFEKLAFSGGPIPVDPEDAGGDDDLAEVCRIADLILMHDLKIWHSSGPSVHTDNPILGCQTIRNSNGRSPFFLPLKRPLKRNVLALGSDSCAAIALGYKTKIYLSHQMGNIQTPDHSKSLSLAAERFAMMFARIPEMIVCDMDHSSYSSKMGIELSERYQIPLTMVQRHHANALSCMTEHKLKDALSLVWDGGSSGPDGTIWGAELLETNISGFRRLATFAPVQMGKPKERTLRPAFLFSRYLEQYGIELTPEQAKLLNISMPIYQEWRHSDKYAQTTETHAALTLFDAVSAAIGIASPVQNYDQQTILRMEHAISGGYDPNRAKSLMKAFPFTTHKSDLMMIDWAPFFQNPDFLPELRKESPGNLAAAFLMSAAEAAFQMVLHGTGKSFCRNIVLSGKAFLSPTLTIFLKNQLEQAGLTVYRHIHTSPDESSVSIGQALFGGMA